MIRSLHEGQAYDPTTGLPPPITNVPAMSNVSLVLCLILTGLAGLVGYCCFQSRSRVARVAVLCGFTAFLLALLSANFHRLWLRAVRHEWAVVTQVGRHSRGHLLVPSGEEVSLSFDRELRVGEEVEILVDDDEGRLVTFPFDDERSVTIRGILFAAAGAALFSWGVFRLRKLGPDPVSPPPELPGIGINPS